MKEVRTVGIIRLGKMGMPMTRLLRERGFTVSGYDVTLAAIKIASGLGV
jgi:3-hydroxyisobutyrate dehydrogenase-like beta-hydroxyacid dehydrogenase